MNRYKSVHVYSEYIYEKGNYGTLSAPWGGGIKLTKRISRIYQSAERHESISRLTSSYSSAFIKIFVEQNTWYHNNIDERKYTQIVRMAHVIIWIP